MDVSQCQLRERPVRAKQPWQQDSSSDHQQHLLMERNLGLDQVRGVLGSCGDSVLSTYEGRQPGELHPKDCQSEYSRAKWH